MAVHRTNTRESGERPQLLDGEWSQFAAGVLAAEDPEEDKLDDDELDVSLAEPEESFDPASLFDEFDGLDDEPTVLELPARESVA